MLALVVAAPAAAVQPTRSLFHLTSGLHPAGHGCAFDISYVDAPGARVAVTDFSDGRETADMHAVATLTNDETGATFVHKAFFHDVSWLDAAGGVYRGMTNGQSVIWFNPGDIGPDGVVGADGLALRIEGTLWYAADATTFAITEFSYAGTLTNVCDLLS
jgi:hypothetical protein